MYALCQITDNDGETNARRDRHKRSIERDRNELCLHRYTNHNVPPHTKALLNRLKACLADITESLPWAYPESLNVLSAAWR